MTRDINGYNGFGIGPTANIQGCSLAANTAQTFTAPSSTGWWIAIFSPTPGAQIFVDFTGATATLPSGTVGAVTVALNPSARRIAGGSTFSVITPDATSPYVTVEYQAVDPYTN